RHGGREGPRGDQERYPGGLADGDDPLVPCRGQRDGTVVANRLFGEPAVELGGVGDLTFRFGEGLAHLEDDERCELVGLSGHQLERTAEDLASLTRRGGCPLAGRCLSGVDRSDGVLGGATRHGRHGLAGGRVENVDLGAVGGLAPLASDQEAVVAQLLHSLEKGVVGHQLNPSETSRFSGSILRPAPSASRLSNAAKSWSPQPRPMPSTTIWWTRAAVGRGTFRSRPDWRPSSKSLRSRCQVKVGL